MIDIFSIACGLTKRLAGRYCSGHLSGLSRSGAADAAPSGREEQLPAPAVRRRGTS
jgi:hypothetical protein